MKGKPLDIMQECTALFRQEDTLAYFDFTLPAGGCAIEGLCRIGHPRRESGGKHYVSLVFIVDTPETGAREQALAALKPLGSGILETMLPEIFSTISVPPAPCDPKMYIKQFDFILKEKLTATQEFIARRLYPALGAALALQPGELGWWDDRQAEKKKLPESGGTRPRSLLERLKDKLARS